MKHFEFGWQADGLQIYAQGWQLIDVPSKAAICLVHGLGEHCSRYAHVAQAFCTAGYSLLAFDQPGHGKSQGKRGDFSSFEGVLDNIETLLNEAGQRYSGLPRFLYGHSMGGNLALNYVLRRQPAIEGVIITAPWLQLPDPLPPYLISTLRGINRVHPSLTLPNRLDTQYISRDQQQVQAYKTDPLIHDRASVRLFCTLYDAGNWALDQAANFPLPLLLMHGANDRLTSPEASQQFAEAAPDYCTFKLWPNLYHEIHNEPEQGEVIAFMVDWIRQLY